MGEGVPHRPPHLVTLVLVGVDRDKDLSVFLLHSRSVFLLRSRSAFLLRSRSALLLCNRSTLLLLFMSALLLYTMWCWVVRGVWWCGGGGSVGDASGNGVDGFHYAGVGCCGGCWW